MKQWDSTFFFNFLHILVSNIKFEWYIQVYAHDERPTEQGSGLI